MRLRAFDRSDTDAVVALWEECGLTRPWNDPRRDIERKLAVQPELFLVGEDEGELIASAMAGYDGHRGWVYYVAVAPDRQGSGLGRLLLAEVEARLTALGCPKVNIQIRSGNGKAAGFWSALGYADDSASGMGKRLIADA
ncbi:GNAT family acetyltransferase [Naasia sp. SYSU D00057]|uniref:GNAT family acetyltransferase n=1 Tax=Naasia sp. SYSU D00057 TaxID=2817380 RepID=UPI0027DD0ED0|nr:GNAT family acetyltransferase [Naasia sp. SYSU D00057]